MADFNLTLIMLMTSIVIIAYFIKGVLGFGEGLITTSFFLLLFDAKFVLPLALLLVLIGGLYQLAYFKKDISVLVIKTIIIPLIIGVAIGAYLLNSLNSEAIRLLFAIFLMAYSVKLLFFPKQKSAAFQKKIKKSLSFL